MRKTSIESYRTIEASGLLSKRRWQVYDHIFHYGPTTARDSWKRIQSHGQISTGGISTRFSELKTIGVLEEVGEAVDKETGMTVLLWDVTDKLPKKYSKKSNPTRNELINALCSKAESMVTYLDSKENLPLKWKVWAEQTKNTIIQCSKYRKRK